jgi:hypothetical protein
MRRIFYSAFSLRALCSGDMLRSVAQIFLASFFDYGLFAVKPVPKFGQFRHERSTVVRAKINFEGAKLYTVFAPFVNRTVALTYAYQIRNHSSDWPFELLFFAVSSVRLGQYASFLRDLLVHRKHQNLHAWPKAPLYLRVSCIILVYRATLLTSRHKSLARLSEPQIVRDHCGQFRARSMNCRKLSRCFALRRRRICHQSRTDFLRGNCCRA